MFGSIGCKLLKILNSRRLLSSCGLYCELISSIQLKDDFEWTLEGSSLGWMGWTAWWNKISILFHWTILHKDWWIPLLWKQPNKDYCYPLTSLSYQLVRHQEHKHYKHVVCILRLQGRFNYFVSFSCRLLRENLDLSWIYFQRNQLPK